MDNLLRVKGCGNDCAITCSKSEKSDYKGGFPAVLHHECYHFGALYAY